MADDNATTGKRVLPRRRWLALLLPVVAVAGYFAYDLVRPRSEEERVLEAYEDFIEAMIDEDFEAAWEMTSDRTRQVIAEELEDLKAEVSSVPPAAAPRTWGNW